MYDDLDPQDDTNAGYQIGGYHRASSAYAVPGNYARRRSVRVIEPLEKRKRDIRTRQRQLEAEMAQLEQYPNTDPYQDGTILRIVVRHDIDAVQQREYVYTAVRYRDGQWTTSGRTSVHNVTWSGLVEWLVGHDVVEMEQIHPIPDRAIDADDDKTDGAYTDAGPF